MKNMHFLVPESKCISYIQFILYVYFLLRASITKRKTQNKEENNDEYENRICTFWCQPGQSQSFGASPLQSPKPTLSLSDNHHFVHLMLVLLRIM